MKGASGRRKMTQKWQKIMSVAMVLGTLVTPAMAGATNSSNYNNYSGSNKWHTNSSWSRPYVHNVNNNTNYNHSSSYANANTYSNQYMNYNYLPMNYNNQMFYGDQYYKNFFGNPYWNGFVNSNNFGDQNGFLLWCRRVNVGGNNTWNNNNTNNSYLLCQRI